MIELYHCAELQAADDLSWPSEAVASASVFGVSPAVYQKIALRGSSEGFIALVSEKNWQLSAIKTNPAKSGFLLACEAVEKPGNLGAILRTADAVGAEAVVVIDPQLDIYSAGCVRASLGAIFSVPIVVCTAAEFLAYCREERYQLFAASPEAERPYFAENFQPATALIFGAEDRGLTSFWDQNVAGLAIPMAGICDSPQSIGFGGRASLRGHPPASLVPFLFFRALVHLKNQQSAVNSTIFQGYFSARPQSD